MSPHVGSATLGFPRPKSNARKSQVNAATCGRFGESVVARAGVEPATFHFSGGRSYQLSYLAVTIKMATRLSKPATEVTGREDRATPTGLEPAASAVTGRRSNQLSYGAKLFRQAYLLQTAYVTPAGFEPALPP